MKRLRFTETQIISILKEAEAGMAAKDICRKNGISSPTYYQWKSKYWGLGASNLKRMKQAAWVVMIELFMVVLTGRDRGRCPVEVYLNWTEVTPSGLQSSS